MRISCILCAALVFGFRSVAPAQNLLVNPGFENGLSGWTVVGDGWRTGAGADAHSGRLGAVCDVLPSQPVGAWRILYQNIPTEPGLVYSASMSLRTVSLKASRSFFEIQFLDASKGVLQQFDTPAVQSNTGYTRYGYPILAVPPKAAWISVRAVVNVSSAPSTPEFHTWDDFDLRELTVSGADKAYLKSIAADTWRSIESLIEPEHGLPYDSSSHGEFTSTTNCGFYMVSVVAAKELGFIDELTAVARIAPVLAAIKRLPKFHGFQATWTSVKTLRQRNDDSEHVVSLLDAGNYLASLILVDQALPILSKECSPLIKAADCTFFYDSKLDRLHGGYDIRTNGFVPNWWVSDFGTDSRLISFLAIGQGVMPTSWSKLNRTESSSHGVRFYDPGWMGGGLFMQYISAMFLDERITAMGESARNFALDQMAHACDIGSPIWGWSACDSTRFGYTNTYGKKPNDAIVAAYASALAIDDWAPAVVANFRKLEELGGRDNFHGFGFYDSFDTQSRKGSNSFLVLDQSMTLISLCNYLKEGRIRSLFKASPAARRAYSLISDP